MSGRGSVGRQYVLPWSSRTAEQSRPLTADTTASTGVRWITAVLPAAVPTTTAARVSGAAAHPPSHATHAISSSQRMPQSMLWVGKHGVSVGLPPRRAAAMVRRPPPLG